MLGTTALVHGMALSTGRSPAKDDHLKHGERELTQRHGYSLCPRWVESGVSVFEPDATRGCHDGHLDEAALWDEWRGLGWAGGRARGGGGREAQNSIYGYAIQRAQVGAGSQHAPCS
jgi:hypothetical protein